jgi:hypothetical protein
VLSLCPARSLFELRLTGESGADVEPLLLGIEKSWKYYSFFALIFMNKRQKRRCP